MSNYIDFHIHSTFSDGVLNVDEIIGEAKKNEAKYIAITDHDVLDGSALLQESVREINDIIAFSGVEITAVYVWKGKKVKIHLLGYDFDLANNDLKQHLDSKRNLRRIQNVAYVTHMFEHFPNISKAILKEIDFSKHAYINKTILNYYKKQDTKEDILNQLGVYLNNNPINYVDYDFDIDEAIRLIHMAGGITVLAHPYQTKLLNEELDLFVNDLISKGLDGIETYYGRASDEDNVYAQFLAKKYNLLESCGSDFHTYIYENFIAYGKNRNLCICDCSMLHQLLERKKYHVNR